MLMEKFGEAVEGQEIYKLTSEIKLFWQLQLLLGVTLFCLLHVIFLYTI